MNVKEIVFPRDFSDRVDFSRDLLVHQANRLLVLRDSGSRWTDLGSTHRMLTGCSVFSPK